MALIRSIVSGVFWIIALLVAIPAICKLQPVVQELTSDWQAQGASSWSTDLANLVDRSGNAAMWLVLSGICIGIALLMQDAERHEETLICDCCEVRAQISGCQMAINV